VFIFEWNMKVNTIGWTSNEPVSSW